MEDIYSAKPWLKFYDDGVPATIDEYPEMSYAEAVHEAFETLPERVALYYMGRDITFREFDIFSSQFAHFLTENNCGAGDTVGAHLLNVPAAFISAIGIQKAGCVYSGVSILLTADELEYQLNDSEAKVLVTFDFQFETVEKVVHRTGVHTIIVVSIADFLPLLKKSLGKLFRKIPKGKVREIEGIKVIRFMDILRDMPGDLVNVKVKPEDPCFMMYTGGTTGPPKGAVLTHGNVVRHMEQMRTWVGSAEIGRHTIASAFPLFHQAGNFLSLWGISMGASTILIPNPRDLKFIISSMKKYRPTAMINVPTIYMELMKSPEFHALDFSGVEFFVSGASPFPLESIREFEKVVGEGKVMEVYGMTETTPLITANPREGLKKVGSVGIPMIDTDVKLVDPETGEVVPLGEAGEILVRGPQVLGGGYHNNPEETAHAFRDGWFHTGDIARMDADGYFYIVDRLKDMLSVSGFKVFTRQVDDVLMEHPDVDIAATIGLPDTKRPGSEIVASCVVLKDNVEKTEEMREKIHSYMKEKVAPYKVPKVIRFMDELPMSAVGKVLKKDLREMVKAD